MTYMPKSGSVRLRLSDCTLEVHIRLRSSGSFAARSCGKPSNSAGANLLTLTDTAALMSSIWLGPVTVEMTMSMPRSAYFKLSISL